MEIVIDDDLRPIDWNEALEQYIKAKKYVGYSSTTLEVRKRTIRRFITFAHSCEISNPQKITKNFIYAFLGHCGENCKNTKKTQNKKGVLSIRNDLSAIRSFLDFLVDERFILENHARYIKPPRARKKEQEYLNEREIKILLDVILNQTSNSFLERNMAIIGLMLFPMLRSREICELKIEDFALEERPTVRVRRKGGNIQFLPVTAETANFIEMYLEKYPGEASDYLFRSCRTKSRMGERALRHMVKKYLLEAGLIKSKMGPHMLRHSGCTLLHKKGVDMRTLQDIMGHSNIIMTERYTHLAEEQRWLAASVAFQLFDEY